MLQQELFPREVTSGVPSITLTGCELLHVEQHRGLLVCREEEIVFATACGRLAVRGKRLSFRLYTAAEALIAGEIAQIGYATEGGNG